MKKLLVLSLVSFLIVAIVSCGGNNNSEATSDESTETAAAETESGNPSYDPHRGEGKFTSVELGTNIDPAKAELGEKVAQVKCTSCHKTTDEKLVGPGWAGVTQRRKPE